ncbi:MAG: PIN domain-containing protein [Nonlabens sp.]
MDQVLLDTDVIMDFFYDRKPFAEYASDVLNLCADGQINGFITPVIISNTYYLLRKTAPHNFTIQRIKQLLTIVDVLSMNRNVVTQALESNFKDFEDALQNYSALEFGSIRIILTRNFKDFKNSELSVFTPQTYLNGRKANES